MVCVILKKSNDFIMSRMFRRLVIVSIFLSFNALLIFGIYFGIIKKPASCIDGIQNQNEQGIDCGGICTNACIEVVVGQDFQTKEVTFVPGGNNRYDVMARIFNGNDAIGAPSFRYTFQLKDASGQVLATRSGNNYILPQETKTLIEVNLESALSPASVSLSISDVSWERFTGYREKPTINIYQKRYNQLTTGAGYSGAYGLVSNESPYDFRSIIVKVILRDSTGKPLAFNQTKQDNVTAGESRDFMLIWPLPFPGTVERVDMEVDADVYHSQNFERQYFPGGRL